MKKNDVIVATIHVIEPWKQDHIMGELQKNLLEFPDEPSSTLLRSLHESLLRIFRPIVIAYIESLDNRPLQDYRELIARLRQISEELGISYEKPEDDLAK